MVIIYTSREDFCKKNIDHVIETNCRDVKVAHTMLKDAERIYDIINGSDEDAEDVYALMEMYGMNFIDVTKEVFSRYGYTCTFKPFVEIEKD